MAVLSESKLHMTTFNQILFFRKKSNVGEFWYKNKVDETVIEIQPAL